MAFKVVILQTEAYYSGAIAKHFDEHGFSVTPIEVNDNLAALLTEQFERDRPSIIILNALEFPASIAEQVVRLCQHFDTPLLCLSSHHVFGLFMPETPWLEHDMPNPSDDFGQQLHHLESLLLQHNKTLVLRLPWVVDEAAVPLLYHLCDAMLAGGKLMVSDSWKGSPIDTSDLVRVVYAISLQMTCGADNWGVFHLRSNDDCSEAEFADYVRRVLAKAGCTALAEIVTVPVEHRFFASNGWLGGNRLTNDFGIQLRSWRQGIKSKVVKWLSQQVDEGRVELHPERTSARSG